jgi:hypothetical protein
MRTRTLVALLFVLAAALWAGFLGYVNLRAPATLGSQVLFLLLAGAAVSSLVVPISYLVNGRLVAWPGPRLMQRAVRQGLIVGTLTVVLLATQMMRLLTLVVVVLLVALAVAAEIMLASRA